MLNNDDDEEAWQKRKWLLVTTDTVHNPPLLTALHHHPCKLSFENISKPGEQFFEDKIVIYLFGFLGISELRIYDVHNLCQYFHSALSGQGSVKYFFGGELSVQKCF